VALAEQYFALLEIPAGAHQTAFKILYVYDYITTLCRAPADLILNHVNPNVRGTGQEEAMHRKNKRL
jgi:hypothetical protein